MKGAPEFLRLASGDPRRLAAADRLRASQPARIKSHAVQERSFACASVRRRPASAPQERCCPPARTSGQCRLPHLNARATVAFATVKPRRSVLKKKRFQFAILRPASRSLSSERQRE